MYKGFGAEAVAATVRHEDLLGRPVEIGNDYLPHNSWAEFDPVTMCRYQFDPWHTWRDERPGSAFVYGVPPLVEGFEGAFARGVAGEFDAAYGRAARALVESGHGDAIVRLGWEPNNRAIGPWQATDDPAGYAALFRHVVDVFRTTPGSCFTFDLSSSLGVQPGRRLHAFVDYYPEDGYVERLGMNVYDLKWGDPTVSPDDRWSWIRSQESGLDAHVAFVRARGNAMCAPSGVCTAAGTYSRAAETTRTASIGWSSISPGARSRPSRTSTTTGAAAHWRSSPRGGPLTWGGSGDHARANHAGLCRNS
ncbi:hypothetical protein AB0C70_08560 [Streptomyces sp. NPDC048564]|uniref:hypothetical protein n=1 Tax=Streptomyces sp. NPDC048564 TaxID=3155760 RepID=UPI00343BA041